MKRKLLALAAAIAALLGVSVVVAPQASAASSALYQAHCGLTGTTAVGGADDKTLLPGQIGWVEFDFYVTINNGGTPSEQRKPGQAVLLGNPKEMRWYNHSDANVTLDEVYYRYVTGGSQFTIVRAFNTNIGNAITFVDSRVSNTADRDSRNWTRFGSGDWQFDPANYANDEALANGFNRFIGVGGDPNLLLTFNYTDHGGIDHHWPCVAFLNP
jgi:hypothetical protein